MDHCIPSQAQTTAARRRQTFAWIKGVFVQANGKCWTLPKARIQYMRDNTIHAHHWICKRLHQCISDPRTPFSKDKQSKPMIHIPLPWQKLSLTYREWLVTVAGQRPSQQRATPSPSPCELMRTDTKGLAIKISCTSVSLLFLWKWFVSVINRKSILEQRKLVNFT